MARGKKAAKELSPEEKLQQALVPVEEQPCAIPDNWLWAKFSNVSNIRTGKKDANYGSCDGQYFFFTCASEPIRCKNYSFDCKAILLAGNGDIGNISIYEGKFEAYQRTYVVEIACPFLTEFFYYYFLYRWVDYNVDKMYGTAIPYIRLGNLQKFPVPIAPLSEQHRIVSRIESLFAKLDEAKEKAQAVVEGFELRKSAIFHKAFTGELTERWRKEHGIGMESWQKTNIGSIADVKGGKRVPKGMSLTTDDTGHPYIKAGNLKLGTVLDEGIMFVPDDVLQYIKNYTVTAGDVYITNVGACIGDCGIIPDKYDGANLTENAVKITNLKCNGQFLARYISSNEVQQRIKNLIASATLGKLSIANIKTISVTLPTDKEQAETIRILERLLNKEQQAKEAAEAVLSQIDTMKKAILARAFRGELGTNDPAEESAVELIKAVL